MTVTEMTDEIRNRMNITSTIITDAEILTALNDGYKDVAVKSLCIEQSQNLTTANGKRYYRFSGIKINKAVFWNLNSATAGYPQYWFQWGQYLVVEPVPDAAYYVVIFVSVLPEEEMLAAEEIEGDEADTPHDLPPEFQHLVVDFALWGLSLKMKKWTKAGMYYNQYITNLKKRKKEYIERKAEKRAIHKIPIVVKSGLRKEVDTQSTHRIPDKVIYENGSQWAH